MAAGRLLWPLVEPVLSATGAVVSGATLTVYRNRTTDLATIYTEKDLVTPAANPQSGTNGSNAAGRFHVQTKQFWVPQGALYTLRVDRPDGTFDVINDVSPQGGEVDGMTNSVGATTIDGLTLSNSATSPTTHVVVAVGQARDSADTVNLALVAPITKRIDLAWSAGNNGGARLSGALGALQTWHWFIIGKADGTTDIGADQSPTAPTLPTGYVYFRRLGAVITDASNVILQFVQHGDAFRLKNRTTDFATEPNGAGPYLRQLKGAPDGIKVEVELYFQTTGTATAGTVFHSGIYDPDFGAPPAFGGATQWAQVRRFGVKDASSANVSYETRIVRQFTDANRQVYSYSNDSADVIVLGVLGWVDNRELR